jgi:uncharacterized membrane protein
MQPSKAKYIQDLLQTEDAHLRKLNKIVSRSVEQEKLLPENLAKPIKESLPYSDTLAGKVAKFGGSWKFIIIFCFILITWIIINEFLPAGKRFDPYPYILMNLVLSCIAAFQAQS